MNKVGDDYDIYGRPKRKHVFSGPTTNPAVRDQHDKQRNDDSKGISIQEQHGVLCINLKKLYSNKAVQCPSLLSLVTPIVSSL